MTTLEDRRARGTWTTEGKGPAFHGASDSVIDAHRPNLSLDPGRRSSWKWVMLVFVLLVVGIGAAAVVWGEDLAAWFQSAQEPAAGDTEADTEAVADTEGETDVAASADAPDSGDLEQGTETSGATGAAAAGDSATGPAHPWATPSESGSDSGAPVATGTPATTGAATGTATATGGSAPTGASATSGDSATLTVTLSALSTSSISKARVQTLWAGVIDKSRACVESLGPSVGVFSGDVSVSVGVKWNGGATGLSAKGPGLPKGVEGCVRSSIPKARYPQPPPGKDGRVRATVHIERK